MAIQNNVSLSNLTDTLSEINYSLEFQNTSNYLVTAIQDSNYQTDGWLGFLFFLMMMFGCYILLRTSPRNQTQIKNIVGALLFALLLGYYMLNWGILESIKIYIQVQILFFSLCVAVYLRKQTFTPDT